MSALHVIAAITADAENYKARAQAEAARQQANDYGRLAKILSGGRTAAPSKCKCCGSHEFRAHAGRTICVYCRVTP